MESDKFSQAYPPEIDWVFGLKKPISNFLEQMKSDSAGRFHYSFSGDIPKDSVHWGLGNTVFAVKIYQILGMLESLPEHEKYNFSRFLLSFQNKDGSFSDPLVARQTAFINFLVDFRSWNFHDPFSHQIRRAETRQTLSALSLLNHQPLFIYQDFPKTVQDVEKHLSALNWEKPWGAGSHFSHLLFFLKKSKLSNQDILIDTAIHWVNQLQHSVDGAWYQGPCVSLQEKVNGAMKILTGLKASNQMSFAYPERLIDTCLDATNNEHACDNFNIVYVLKYANEQTKRTYRLPEIEQFALNRLSLYRNYYFPEMGGFSFKLGKANDTYYGAKISHGLEEPDIHGTAMFLWGISVIAQILGFNDRLKWNEIIP